jgi:zinc-binding in reverse transcriptase
MQQLDTSVAQALQDAQTLVRDIHTLSVQTQQVQLLQYISQEKIHDNCQDKIIWNWTTSDQFTVKYFYMAIKEGPLITCKFSVIWTLQLPTRVAIFQWLIFKNRLLTVNNLIRKG